MLIDLDEQMLVDLGIPEHFHAGILTVRFYDASITDLTHPLQEIAQFERDPDHVAQYSQHHESGSSEEEAEAEGEAPEILPDTSYGAPSSLAPPPVVRQSSRVCGVCPAQTSLASLRIQCYVELTASPHTEQSSVNSKTHRTSISKAKDPLRLAASSRAVSDLVQSCVLRYVCMCVQCSMR